MLTSGKHKGGGLALFINARWCNTGPFPVFIFLHRDGVWYHPLYSTIAVLPTHPETFFAIFGYFNHITLETLPAYHQFVDCLTRKSRTFDLLYANVTDAHIQCHLRANLITMLQSMCTKVTHNHTQLQGLVYWGIGGSELLLRDNWLECASGHWGGQTLHCRLPELLYVRCYHKNCALLP